MEFQELSKLSEEYKVLNKSIVEKGINLSNERQKLYDRIREMEIAHKEEILEDDKERSRIRKVLAQYDPENSSGHGIGFNIRELNEANPDTVRKSKEALSKALSGIPKMRKMDETSLFDYMQINFPDLKIDSHEKEFNEALDKAGKYIHGW
jgi:hypothetical protein